MKSRYYFIPLFILSAFSLTAQDYDEYIGKDGHQPIQIYSSDNHERPGSDEIASANKTIAGQGLDFDQLTMARFLSQAAIGYSPENINQAAPFVNNMEDWIDWQVVVPVSLMQSTVANNVVDVNTWALQQGADSTEIDDRASWVNFNYSWWELNMSNADLLRQKVALALSEILVVSFNSDLANTGMGVANYYDIFINNAFGNYRDILEQVTYSPCMGFYLSHLNNPKANPSQNVHPDENYARELMQLFTIGLYELNLDGSRKTDMNGDFIPTYTQDDIREFAKIFTGLGYSAVMDNMYGITPNFGVDQYFGLHEFPMQMYQDFHEYGTKTLLNNQVIPIGQTGDKDISDALDNVFNHPNVGPFISRLLIQRMVTSNPSPEYIANVATMFNNNGQGVRGDMLAVVKAILLDEEARDCQMSQSNFHGMLKEPIVRYAHFARAVEKQQYYNQIWHIGYEFMRDVGQHPMSSPSVFNFFLPDYEPQGTLSDNGLKGPEFQIHNSKTSINYLNFANRWAVWQSLMYNWEENSPGVRFIVDDFAQVARTPEVLINKIDLMFTNGMMTDRTRGIIKEAIEPIVSGAFRSERARLALYLTLISPDYAVLK